jgi:hypothetical protein
MIIKKDAEHARLEWVRGWGLVIHFVRESFGRLVLFEKIAWVSRARALLPRKDMACGVPREPVRERCVVGRQSGESGAQEYSGDRLTPKLRPQGAGLCVVDDRVVIVNQAAIPNSRYPVSRFVAKVSALAL